MKQMKLVKWDFPVWTGGGEIAYTLQSGQQHRGQQLRPKHTALVACGITILAKGKPSKAVFGP